MTAVQYVMYQILTHCTSSMLVRGTSLTLETLLGIICFPCVIMRLRLC